MRSLRYIATLTMLVAWTSAASSQELPSGEPAARIDLRTTEGARLVQGTWRYSDVELLPVEHRAPDDTGQPTGATVRTWDIRPRAGERGFDDSAWPVLDPTTLGQRRGHGRVSFNWYRIAITVPERVDSLATAGTTVVLATSLDDYAEVWVDGELPRATGQSGGSVVGGWNATNRLIVARNVRPGQRIEVAIFGMNGPISDPPANFIWMRLAELQFYPGSAVPLAVPPQEVNLRVQRLDPALDAIVPSNPKLFKLAEGFQFTEGPVWAGDGGYLLFSDPNANRIYKYTESTARLEVFREQSGYDGADVAEYGQPGSNGLAIDGQGRLTIDQHGHRRVVRLERDGTLTVIADRYQGRRLNSPNDLVYRSDGSLYFTDPPFGLPRFYDDPRKELPHSGVYRAHGGEVRLLATDLRGPNGLAFSPDEHFLYVANWDPKAKLVLRYPVQPDGDLGQPSVFVDLTRELQGDEALDGLKVDALGNVYLAAPDGLRIYASDGRHLGTITAPRPIHNFAWGGADGRTLYLTARDRLYRLPLLVGGATAFPSVPGRIVRLDPRLDALLPGGAALESVATGHRWVEGPAWDRAHGALLYSDIPANAVYRWQRGSGVRRFLEPSGYSGAAPFTGREPGSNGLTFDAAGRLVLCEHGDRRITRLEADGRRTVLVDRYEGHRLNSPNDAVYARNGDLYFTDPPFGLPRAFEDPARELPHSGVYRLRADGELELLIDDLHAPNGIALSPDERTLYVTDVRADAPAWYAYDLVDDRLGPRRLFADARPWVQVRRGGPDGLETDARGNVFAAGPEGVFVFATDGTLLGLIETGVPTANVAWGEDGSTLFIAADTAIYRLPTRTRAAQWPERGTP